jgi:TRAP-type C4-dicarboxylate transport system substrate-binding protein
MNTMQKIRSMIIMMGALLLVSWNVQAGEIKIALDCPPDLDKCGTYVWSNAFSEYLKAKGLKTKFFQRDALGGEEEKLDQICTGLLEVSNSDLSKAGQLDPMIFGFYLPYLFNSMAHMDRVIEKTDLMDRINAGLTKKGARLLALIPVGGFSGIANTKKPVKTPADMKGLRMRAMDKKQATWLEAWGANSVIIPWAEIYNSLMTGVADGYMNAAIVPVMFKHTEVLKYFSDAKIMAPLRVALASEDWYAGLSEKERGIVHEAVAKANAANREWQKKIEKSGLDAVEKAGVKVVSMSDADRELFAKAVRPLYKKLIPADVAEAFLSAAQAYK